MSSLHPTGQPVLAGDPRLRRRLGDVLVEAGVVSPADVEQALTAQHAGTGPRRRLGQVLVDLGLATERQIADSLAHQLGLETVDLSRMALAPETVRLLPRAVAERTRVLVLDSTANGLLIATSDPMNVLALDDVKLYTRRSDLLVVVATDSQIRDQLTRAWRLTSGDSNVAAMAQDADDEGTDDLGAIGNHDDAPVVTLVNRVLADAVRLHASDIHIEVQRDGLRIRFRVDGLLREVMTAARSVAPSVTSRLKIMAGLDIAERRVPQDGRFRITVDGAAIDTRVSTLPSLHGEKVVIRLLTRGDDVPSLASLGFEEHQLSAVRRALSASQGLVLITGPTGSGKTNTLYSAMAEIVSADSNIVTLEDPVEVQMAGITQVQVHEKSGMTFEKGLRSILRQDPDIVLVGEVRDTQTAELALKASLTGHLVLTTLHTNSAVAALTRLVDMGIEPFLVASSLTAAVAQRLVRKPCPSCAEAYLPGEDVLAGLGLRLQDVLDATPVRGAGCQECGDSGYRGRTAVYEVLVVDAAMRKVLVRDPSEGAVSAQARTAGMLTLRAAAIEKARRGETTFEEALRVTTADAASGLACPSCERTVDSDMVACPWCAVTLERDTCRSCERPVEQQWRICPWCRAPVARSLASGQHPGDTQHLHAT